MKFSKRWLWMVLSGVNLLVILVMQIVSTDLAPYNIIQFELAGNVRNAQMLVGFWRQNEALNSVFFLIGFDYLFLVTYGLFLWLGCKALASAYDGMIRNALTIVASAQSLAAGLDAIENVALYQMASGSLSARWPNLSYYCAVPKFLFVAAGVIAMLFGAVRWMLQSVKG
ncbi:MAG: hypothetical protein AB7K37_07890 [Cyclobacteriaceae bacterium]